MVNLHETPKPARMVDMSVRKYKIINGLYVDAQFLRIVESLARQTRVNKDSMRIGLNEQRKSVFRHQISTAATVVDEYGNFHSVKQLLFAKILPHVVPMLG